MPDNAGRWSMAMGEWMSGGCQCGRIRYEAEIEGDEAYLCHCRMCQRATGNVSIAFCNVPRAAVRWTTVEPDRYASSSIARRGYCAQCGTPLSFEFVEGGNMDLTVGSFDDPSRFRPVHHFGAESLHGAWLDTGGLKRIRSDEHPGLVERWVQATGAMPQ